MVEVADQTYFTIPGVASVKWVEADQMTFVEWEGWANSSEFTALLEAEVRALEEHGGSCLLADCRLQRVLSTTEQQRANRDWVPRVVEAGLKRFAVVLPLNELAAGHIRERLSEVPETAFEVAYFTTVEEAAQWLRGQAGSGG